MLLLVQNSNTTKKLNSCDSGFTLIELVVVITIMGLVAGFVSFRSGAFSYWEEEAMIRKLSETISFLHHRAVMDSSFYRMEFDLDPDKPSYRIGEIVPEGADTSSLSVLASAGVGVLSIELADHLSPSMGQYQNMIAPRSMPSLAKPVHLPRDVIFEDIHTMRGKFQENPDDGNKPYIVFSPRGFSEFAVIHLLLSAGGQVTILVNPFTGLTSIYREYKEFEWTYGRKKDESST